jgi:uncharacterized protein Yka (UPF0111/DUF47 family)
MSLTQKQKDTIREEIRNEMHKQIIRFYNATPVYRTVSEFCNFFDTLIDQAYQSGAKDKVEEVRGDIKNYSETRDNSEARGAIWDILDLPSLKDNT